MPTRSSRRGHPTRCSRHSRVALPRRRDPRGRRDSRPRRMRRVGPETDFGCFGRTWSAPQTSQADMPRSVTCERSQSPATTSRLHPSCTSVARRAHRGVRRPDRQAGSPAFGPPACTSRDVRRDGSTASLSFAERSFVRDPPPLLVARRGRGAGSARRTPTAAGHRPGRPRGAAVCARLTAPSDGLRSNRESRTAAPRSGARGASRATG